jgi:ketosteroid isomerase-like protein
MASLYHHAPETVSFSPNSALRFQGWDVIADGLKKYFDSAPGTYSWTMEDEAVTMLSGDVAVIHGFHVVVDRPADGKEMTGRHLFTRIVRKIDGRWRIVHEHESHIPRAMPPQQL